MFRTPLLSSSRLATVAMGTLLIATGVSWAGGEHAKAEEEKPAAVKTEAAAPVHPAPEGWTAYGAGVSESKAVAFEKLMSSPAKYAGKTLVVEGPVSGVCQNKGCWMTLQHDGKEMRVRFKDYGFFVPKDVAGSTVRMEGVFSIEKIPVDEARHYLEDAGRKEDAAKITEPVDGFTFMASGVILHP